MPDLPHDPWNEIIPGLWMGGSRFHERSTGLVREAKAADLFDVVISMNTHFGRDVSPAMGHWSMPINDGELTPPELLKVQYCVDKAVQVVQAGGKILVRCNMGLNRSGLVVALAMLRLGHTPTGAILFIRRERGPDALSNPHFRGYISQAFDTTSATGGG